MPPLPDDLHCGFRQDQHRGLHWRGAAGDNFPGLSASKFPAIFRQPFPIGFFLCRLSTVSTYFPPVKLRSTYSRPFAQILCCGALLFTMPFPEEQKRNQFAPSSSYPLPGELSAPYSCRPCTLFPDLRMLRYRQGQAGYIRKLFHEAS